jgi:uncharacterized protein with FMN-binding domain
MAGLARRLAPAAALGGLAIIIVGVADPALAGRTEATTTGTTASDTATAPDLAATEAPATEAPATEAPATEAPATEAPATEAATCDSGDTVTGDSVMTQWGPVQVSATVAGAQVCEVHAVSWPSSDGRSQMINAYAIPQLDQTATASGGTQLDYVSGATYTSNAYAQSLQSILDAL